MAGESVLQRRATVDQYFKSLLGSTVGGHLCIQNRGWKKIIEFFLKSRVPVGDAVCMQLQDIFHILLKDHKTEFHAVLSSYIHTTYTTCTV